MDCLETKGIYIERDVDIDMVFKQSSHKNDHDKSNLIH
jgi:hypothetical protein